MPLSNNLNQHPTQEIYPQKSIDQILVQKIYPKKTIDLQQFKELYPNVEIIPGMESEILTIFNQINQIPPGTMPATNQPSHYFNAAHTLPEREEIFRRPVSREFSHYRPYDNAPYYAIPSRPIYNSSYDDDTSYYERPSQPVFNSTYYDDVSYYAGPSQSVLNNLYDDDSPYDEPTCNRFLQDRYPQHVLSQGTSTRRNTHEERHLEYYNNSRRPNHSVRSMDNRSTMSASSQSTNIRRENCETRRIAVEDNYQHVLRQNKMNREREELLSAESNDKFEKLGSRKEKNRDL